MKWLTPIVSFLVLLVLLSGCTSKDGSVIKIGVAGPHTGNLASYGIPTVRAMELLVEKYNAKTRTGNTVELLVEDEQCEASQATNVAAKLIGHEIAAVIGHICSSATLAGLNIYKSENKIAISPSSTNPDLRRFPNFFRTIASDDAQARLQVEYLLSLDNINKVAILHDKGDYGRGLAENAKIFVEQDGRVEIVLFEGITTDALDYSAIVLKIAQVNADAVIFGGYHPEASKIVALMRTQKLEIPFISGDGIKDPSFIDIAKEAAEGVIATGPMAVNTAALQEAEAAHRERYGEDPGLFFKEGYAAGEIILQAIEIAGGTEYEALRKTLLSNEFTTVLGKISFDKNGDAVGVGFSVYEVQNGSYEEVPF